MERQFALEQAYALRKNGDQLTAEDYEKTRQPWFAGDVARAILFDFIFFFFFEFLFIFFNYLLLLIYLNYFNYFFFFLTYLFDYFCINI